MSSKFINYSTSDSERNWKDLCIQGRDQQTCSLIIITDIEGGPIFDPTFADSSL